MNCGRIVGIDPGSDMSGVAVIEAGRILQAFEVRNDLLWDKITVFLIYPGCIVAVEDIKPYSLPLNPDVIKTCKFLGVLEERLKMACGEGFRLVDRVSVRKWVFDSFPDTCRPMIEEKIAKKARFKGSDPVTREEIWLEKDGKRWKSRQASFHYVDDRIVKECMTVLWEIPKPKQGKPYDFGLKPHSFQALALASFAYLG